MKRHRIILLICCGLLTLVSGSVSGVVRTWDGGGGNSDWFTDANWSGDSRPGAGDDAEIGGGVTVVLSAGTPALSAFTITNATLVFTNWTTTLDATNVTVKNGGGV